MNLQTKFLVLGAIGLWAGSSAFGAIIHRYSFSGVGGDGAAIIDSVGGAHGVVVDPNGTGAVLAGGSLSLPGGGSGVAAYGDLPNGLIGIGSGLTEMTIEGWVTHVGNNTWSRIFDFGSTFGGELNAPGGGGAGQDYLFLSAQLAANPNQQRLEIRNSDPAGGGPVTFAIVDTNLVTALPASYHFAVTVTDNGPNRTIASYRDGIFAGSLVTTISLENLNDVNNWLGRSNWTADANFNGIYDEFRIYDNALSGAEIAASFALGPNTVPEPSTYVMLSLLLIGFLVREKICRRRQGGIS